MAQLHQSWKMWRECCWHFGRIWHTKKHLRCRLKVNYCLKVCLHFVKFNLIVERCFGSHTKAPLINSKLMVINQIKSLWHDASKTPILCALWWSHNHHHTFYTHLWPARMETLFCPPLFKKGGWNKRILFRSTPNTKDIQHINYMCADGICILFELFI